MINQPPRPQPSVSPPTPGVQLTPTPATGIKPTPSGLRIGTPVSKTALPKLPKLPGAFNINLADPVGSANENARESADFIHGLGQTLFGKGTGSLLGDIPVLGDVVRGAADVPGVKLVSDAVGATVSSFGIGAAVEAASHTPAGWIPGPTGSSDATFEALPHTPEWEVVNQQANSDFLGGGNLKFDYTKKFLEDQEDSIKESGGIATLSRGLLAGPGGSLGGLIGQALNVFQLPQRYTERSFAGVPKILSGMNRVQETLARAKFGYTDLSPVELAVVQHIGDGSWTEDRALDFMASHGSGLSHDQVLQLVGSFATDPTVVASLGSGGLARLGIRGVKLLEEGAVAASNVDRAAIAVAKAQAGTFGRVSRYARTMIDPLSAIGAHSRVGPAIVNLAADKMATEGWHLAHTANPAAAYRLARDAGLDVDSMYAAAAARGSTVTHSSLAEMKQAEIVWLNNAEGFMSPTQEAARLIEKSPRWTVDRVRQMAHQFRKFVWDDVRKTALAEQMSRRFGGDIDKVTAMVNKAGDDQLGLFHDILYGGDERAFRQSWQEGAREYTGRVPYHRLNMMNDTTLTDLGAAGYLNRVKDLDPNTIEAQALLNEMQERFPAMKKYGDNVQYSIDDLNRRVEEGVNGSLPHQVTADEMADMPQAVRDFFADNPHRTLGFRPPDGQLWNLSINPVDGMLQADGDPWVEHVFEGVEYRPGFALPFNIAGQVVPGPVGRALDWLEAGPRLLQMRTSGAVLRAQAEQSFIKTALKHNGDVITEDMARRAFKRIAAAFDPLDKPTVLSMKPEQMMDALEGVLPFGHNLTKRDVLRWMVDGFEGDISKVGLGQKVPNKIRTWMTRALGYNTNAMYEFSQGLYNQLRFRGPLAIMFKKQEQIEPFALNVMEGTRMGRVATEQNLETAATVNNMREYSILSGFDQTDLLEQAPFAMRGPGLPGALRDLRGSLEAWLNPDLAELKRLGQMNMIEARLGSAVRGLFEEQGRLDDFVEFKNTYAQMIGHPVTDAEYAQHWLNGLQSATLSLGEDSRRLNLDSVFHEFEMFTPDDVGKVKRLGLDMTAAKLDTLNGNKIKNLRDLVEAMTPRDSKPRNLLVRDNDIRFALGKIGAPPAYVERFMTALNFDWGRFWNMAAEKYNLTADDLHRLQTWTTEIAHLNGFKPVEFLSQVVSSGIRQKWTEEEIDKAVALGLNVLKSEKDAKPELLVRELSGAFFAHLHPSGRESLLRALGDDAGLAGLASPPVAAVVDAASWTPRVARPAPSGMYEHTVANGGGTFDAATGKEMGLTSGYGVGAGGHGTVVDNTQAAVEAGYSKVSETGAPHIGTWLNPEDGKVYIDPTETIMDRAEAVALGKARGEKAIYDHAAGKDIVLADEPIVPVRGVTPEVGAEIQRLYDEAAKLSSEPVFVAGAKDVASVLDDIETRLPDVDTTEIRRLLQSREASAAAGSSDLAYFDKAIEGAALSVDEAVQRAGGLTRKPEADALIARAQALNTPAGAGAIPGFGVPPPEPGLPDGFADQLVERARTGVPSTDPNLENAFRYFAEWAQKTLSESALGAAKGELPELLKNIPGGGKPFDHTQDALVDAVLQRMREMETETYRLQYFARDRSLIERSLNHPMFALYPASYMWFKIMPQMVKFIAHQPFGLKTGALAYALADIQKDVMIQREFDPDFTEKLDDATGNQFLWLLSYLLPATPWDIPTAWPAWARDLAGQGLANERRVQQGQQPKGLNIGSVVTRIGDTISPLRSIEQTLRAGSDLGDILTGSAEEQKKNPGQAGLTAKVAGPIQQLAEPLGDAAAELTRILTGQ